MFALPVPVPHPSPDSVRLYHTGNILWLIETVWGLAVPAVIFFSGLSARMREAASRLTSHRFSLTVTYGALLTLTLGIAQLPLDYFSGFVLPHAYGLSSQTLPKFVRDEAVSFALALGAGAVLLWIPYALMHRSPQRWWLYCWLISVPVSFALAFVEPIWIEPLFNQFAPMPESPLKARIVALAHRAGIEDARVYQVDKSVDTNELNAYVTGIGSTTRIVLWDTLIEAVPPDEVLATMGHEMGHFALGHTWSGWVWGSAGLLVLLRVLDLGARGVLTRFCGRARVTDLADVASMPLFALLAGGLLLAARPPVLSFVRHQEHEADRFGLEITHDNLACATSFARFVTHDLAYPDPGAWHVFWRSTHPPLRERIEFCNEYHPWLSGRAERYARYFKP